jgi:hypothetical protein
MAGGEDSSKHQVERRMSLGLASCYREHRRTNLPMQGGAKEYIMHKP